MRTIWLILCLWATTFIQGRTWSDTVFVSPSYTSESFSFWDASKKHLLEGVLTVPKQITSTTKVVVLVAPPLPVPRDYYGLFSTLADVLSKKGIVTLRFDNRAYTDKTLSAREDSITMFDQANDVHQALEKLKKDKRFIHHPLGLLGHSEGGATVSIEASRNKEVSFIVCLSPCGVKGVEFAYEQTATPIEFNKKMPNDIKQELLANLKSYLCVVNDHNSLDSIKFYLKQTIEKGYNSTKYKDKLYGKGPLDEYINTIVWGYTRPRLMAFIKYDPNQYYPTLSCPVLVMNGKMDGNQDCQKHLAGLKNILERSGKQNYEVIAVDSLNHGYKKVDRTIPFFLERMMSRNPNAPKPKYSIETFEYIAKWINLQIPELKNNRR